MREEVTVERLLREFRPLWAERGRKHFTFRWHSGRQAYVEGTMARITTEQQVAVSVAPKTAAGRDAQIDGQVAFESSDPAVALVVSTGPMSALVKAVAPGVCQIFAAFDADLGEGVRAIELSGALEVVAAEAVGAEIVFGTPEPQPL
jgi:hypothetical protein